MKKDEKNELATFTAESLAKEITGSIAENILEVIKPFEAEYMGTLEQVVDRTDSIEGRMDKLENSTTIDHNAQSVINKHTSARIHALLGKSTDPDYIKYGRTFKMRLWVCYRDRFGVSSYRDTRQVDYDEAVTFCDEWFPENGVEALKQEIDEIKRIQEELGL